MRTKHNIAALLEKAGAKPPRYGRGKWRCPRHNGTPSLTVNLDGEWFRCWNSSCDFKGNIYTLRRQLGMSRPWIPAAEFRLMVRAKRLAAALHDRAEALRCEWTDALLALAQIERGATKAGVDHPYALDAMALVLEQRPWFEEMLDKLEDCYRSGSVPDLLQLLNEVN
jgi:hypothetical protein